MELRIAFLLQTCQVRMYLWRIRRYEMSIKSQVVTGGVKEPQTTMGVTSIFVPPLSDRKSKAELSAEMGRPRRPKICTDAEYEYGPGREPQAELLRRMYCSQPRSCIFVSSIILFSAQYIPQGAIISPCLLTPECIPITLHRTRRVSLK